jgi:hypothetical protein
VVKISRSGYEVVLRTMKHTIIYHGSNPSLVVLALRPSVWYWRWTGVTAGEWRAREVRIVKGEMDLVPLPEGYEGFYRLLRGLLVEVGYFTNRVKFHG